MEFTGIGLFLVDREAPSMNSNTNMKNICFKTLKFQGKAMISESQDLTIMTITTIAQIQSAILQIKVGQVPKVETAGHKACPQEIRI